MSQPTVYLVHGANRGIGFTLVQQLTARPNVIVFAGIRSFPPAEDSDIAKLAAKLPDVVVPVKLTAGDEKEHLAAVELIVKRRELGRWMWLLLMRVSGIFLNIILYQKLATDPPFGSQRVPLSLTSTTSMEFTQLHALHVHLPRCANAPAVLTGLNTISDLSLSTLQTHIDTNVFGPVVLFRSFATLLSKSTAEGAAKFVVISSLSGSISTAPPLPTLAYGISKAGANYVAKFIDMENEGVTSVPMHPGLVDTDMSQSVVKLIGADFAVPITQEESAKEILAVVDKATKSSHGGKFWSYTGEELPY